MRSLLVTILFLLAINTLVIEAAFPTADDLDQVVPNLSKAVEAVRDNQPFFESYAENVFYNYGSSPLPSIPGLKVPLDTPEGVADKKFRLDKGYDYLKGLGIKLRPAWGDVFMDDRHWNFLKQLSEAIGKETPVPETKSYGSSFWFRIAFENFLKQRSWADGLDFKTKVYGAIDLHYPKPQDHSRYLADKYYVDRKTKALNRAMKYVHDFEKHGLMPQDKRSGSLREQLGQYWSSEYKHTLRDAKNHLQAHLDIQERLRVDGKQMKEQIRNANANREADLIATGIEPDSPLGDRFANVEEMAGAPDTPQDRMRRRNSF